MITHGFNETHGGIILGKILCHQHLNDCESEFIQSHLEASRIYICMLSRDRKKTMLEEMEWNNKQEMSERNRNQEPNHTFYLTIDICPENENHQLATKPMNLSIK